MSSQKWIKLWIDFLENDKILAIFSGEWNQKNDGSVNVNANGFTNTNANGFTNEKLTKNVAVSEKKRDTILMIWIQLLCLAGRIGRGGVLAVTDTIPYTPKLIAEVLRRKVSDVTLALEIYSNYGMIELVDGFLTIRNWQKYQGSEVEDRKREYNRERYAKMKERQEENTLFGASETGEENDKICQNETTEKRQNLSLQKKNKNNIKEMPLPPYVGKGTKKSGDVVAEVVAERAVAVAADDGREDGQYPDVDQVRAECEACGLSVDPARFVSYYAQRGWVTNGVPVTDWRALLLSWESNTLDDTKPPPGVSNLQTAKKVKSGSPSLTSFETVEAFEAALRRSYGDDYERFFVSGKDSANG